MQLLLNVLVSIAWVLEEEEKMTGEKKSPGSLNLLEVASARGGGACNNCGREVGRALCNNYGYLSVCQHLCYQAQQSVIKAQILDI